MEYQNSKQLSIAYEPVAAQDKEGHDSIQHSGIYESPYLMPISAKPTVEHKTNITTISNSVYEAWNENNSDDVKVQCPICVYMCILWVT